MKLIDKDAVLAEIERRIKRNKPNLQKCNPQFPIEYYEGYEDALCILEDFINTFEIKEVDIEKMCNFKRSVGFSFPENASEYQMYLYCYKQGIKDVLKAQKGE